MKGLACLVSVITLTVGFGAAAMAHDLRTLNGQAQDHQHVEAPGRYGSTPRQGHYAKPPGSNGILIYSAKRTNSYGNAVPVQDFEQSMARQKDGARDREDPFEAQRQQKRLAQYGKK